MKSPSINACLVAVLCSALPTATSAAEPRSYASAVANPSGPPDEVATMIMLKSIFPMAIHAVAFSPDGRLVAGGDGTGRFRLWEAVGGKLTHDLPAHSNWVFGVSWTADGKSIVTGGGDNLIHWFDGRNPTQPTRTMSVHSNDVHAIALTRDGGTMFSTGDDRQIVEWDLERNSVRRRWDGHERQIPTLILSPDENLIATGSRDDSIKLWDARAGVLRETLIGHTGDVIGLSYSPDGSLLASAGWDYTVRLWDVRTGKAVRILLGHPNWVSAVAFSPDGRRLASSSGFKLRQFDVANGEEVWVTDFLGVIRGEAGSETPEDLSTVVFSPDGKVMAVGSTNGSVYLVSAESGEVLRQLRAN